MLYEPTEIPDVFCLTPKVFPDKRGAFMETWRENDFAAHIGDYSFVQENQSSSCRGVLRGLHFQIRQSQGKLVRCVQGEIFDVAVDLRPFSPTCGKWVGRVLNEQNNRQLWLPPGFAHGFYTLSDQAILCYKCTDYYAPEHERTLLWDDPTVSIKWQDQKPLLSPKDLNGMSWNEVQKELATLEPKSR